MSDNVPQTCLVIINGDLVIDPFTEGCLQLLDKEFQYNDFEVTSFPIQSLSSLQRIN